MRKGERAYEKGDLEDARAIYLRVLEIDPQGHRAHYALGMVHYSSDENQEALAAFTRAMELAEQEDRARYRLQRGNTLIAMKRVDEAIADYEEVMREDPRLDRVYYAMGIAHYNRRDYGEAIRWLRSYLRRAPLARDRERVEQLIEFLGG